MHIQNLLPHILLYVLTSFIYLFKIYSIQDVPGFAFHTIQILIHFSIMKTLCVGAIYYCLHFTDKEPETKVR